MTGIMFCVGLLLAISLTLDAANEVSQVLDADLKTWSRLKRDAGYRTEAGKWRGGFYHWFASTETERYRCLQHTNRHCTKWSVSELGDRHERGTCRCKESDSPYCQRWQCNTQYTYKCGDSDDPRTCLTAESLKCTCVAPGENERYCWKWRCREDSTKRGGYHEDEDYECVIPDVSGEFCFKWHGNTTSKYEVESSACECFERGEGFCKYWMCRERGLTRCAQSGQGWCRLEIAIVVGGGMGLLIFTVAIACCSRIYSPEKLSATSVVICFVVFCLPWLVGVVIWGGVFGFPWVIVMWFVALRAVIWAVNREESTRDLNNVRPRGIQLPVWPVRRKQVADSGENGESGDA